MKSTDSFLRAALCALVMSLSLAAAAGEETPSASASAPLEVVFVLDTSTSAIEPSGADIDGDGRVATQKLFLGFLPIRPKRSDSLLAAELRAVRAALEHLDPRSTRVGVVGYAGDAADAAKRGADVLAPLTREYDQVRAALDALAKRGPKGLTDLSAGIDLAARELRAASAPDSAPEGAQSVMILLSDGRPTLPHRGDPVTNRSDSVAAAQRAGVRILVHGIGPDPFESLLRAIAEASKGAYARVENAAQLDLLAGIRSTAP